MKKWISWLSVVLGTFPFLILLWPLDAESGIRHPRDLIAGVIPCLVASIICIVLNADDVKRKKPLTARGALSVVEQYIAMFPFFGAAVTVTITMITADSGNSRAWQVSIAVLLISGLLHIVPISNAIGLICRLPSLMTEDRRGIRTLHIILQFIPIANLIDSWHLLQMSRYEGEQITRARWASLYMGVLVLLLVSLLLARIVVWWILT
ncbi:MAG: hypothetical protein ACI4W2_11675 [Eubacterium sp.]